MFLLHCLAEPCCGAVLLVNPLLRILKSKRLRPFKLLTSFSALFLAESKTSYLCGRLLPRNNPKFFLFAFGVDLVVGRLGFEPRQRDSKSLDLPLVDRPVNRRLQVDLTIDLTYQPGEATLRTSVPNTLPVAGPPPRPPARHRTRTA